MNRRTEPQTVINPWGILAWTLVVIVATGGPAWVLEQWIGIWS